MKDAKEQRKHALTVVAIVGGGGVVLFFLVKGAEGHAPPPAPAGRHGSRSSSSSKGSRSQPQPSRHTMNFAPNPANASLEESIAAARASALNTFDQSAVAERGIASQQTLGLAQDRTSQAIAFNQTAAQLKETGMTTTAAEAVAEKEAAAQEAAAQAQASAYVSAAQAQAQPAQTQASGNWFSSILGGIGSILPFLGL